MATQRSRGARITVDLGDRQLYRRLKVAAVENDMGIRDIVIEAVEYWLDHQDEIEDELAARKADRVEAGSTGEYIPHEDIKRRAVTHSVRQPQAASPGQAAGIG